MREIQGLRRGLCKNTRGPGSVGPWVDTALPTHKLLRTSLKELAYSLLGIIQGAALP